MEVVEGGEVVVADAGDLGVVVVDVVDSVTAADGVVEIAFEMDESDATSVLEATLTDEATSDGTSTGVDIV